MSELVLQGVSHAYDNRQILNGVSFELAKGEIGCLMGPSGSGKTTVLLCIAGLERINEGRITLRGKVLSDGRAQVSPEKRRVGMVFQDFALFPHLNVEKNITFGLRHLSAVAARSRADEMMELCDLRGSGDAQPHELSGGQQQRVALARALANEPDVLLLDEPFSKLDVALHEKLSRQVRDILKARGQTTLVVTHNQQEAFLIADGGGVINEGTICQWDDIDNLYHQPRCTFVASFVGEGNLLCGRMTEDGAVEAAVGRITDAQAKSNYPLLRPGEAVKVLLRPDNIVLDDDSDEGVMATVERRAFRGSTTLYSLRLDNGERVTSISPSHASHSPGDKISIRATVRRLILFPALD